MVLIEVPRGKEALRFAKITARDTGHRLESTIKADCTVSAA
jgi:hypothetical protein